MGGRKRRRIGVGSGHSNRRTKEVLRDSFHIEHAQAPNSDRQGNGGY